MTRSAVIVGSGAGASITAMVLAEANWQVTMLERGPSYFSNLHGTGPIGTVFSNDELKAGRFFEKPDPLTEPRTFRTSDTDTNPLVGSINPLPTVVGGGTVHWDAKVPRFWDLDFKKLSLLGPFPGADVTDWPFSYADLAPYYTRVEELVGVQGDSSAIPALTLQHAPGARGFVLPPGPQQYASMVAASGCTAYGLHPYPFPMGINSVEYDGRPPCNNCGQCSGYGCPINARVGALAPLRRALRTGRVELRPLTFVDKVVVSGRRAAGVHWIGAGGHTGVESADVVVLAASAPETCRIALLSGFDDPHNRIGRDFMWHDFIDGFAIFLRERMHSYRGRSTTQCCEDFCDPDYAPISGGPTARAFAQAAGIPYFRAGIMELGGSEEPLAEAANYQFILEALASADQTGTFKPFGAGFKQLMRSSVLRDRLAGISLVGEDLPYPTNRVDLDPHVRDVRGVPVARITYAQGKHEQVAAAYYIPHLTAVLKASGADVAAAVPESVGRGGGQGGGVSHGAHIMGGMRMGDDPATSVTDAWGMLRGLDNVLVADGSVFPTSGGGNPTLTILAAALRNASHLAATDAVPATSGRDAAPTTHRAPTRAESPSQPGSHAGRPSRSGHRAGRPAQPAGPLAVTGDSVAEPATAAATIGAAALIARAARHSRSDDA